MSENVAFLSRRQGVYPKKETPALFFSDEIGNVSTSYARRTVGLGRYVKFVLAKTIGFFVMMTSLRFVCEQPQYVYAQLEPRYPVLGGWKADW